MDNIQDVNLCGTVLVRAFVFIVLNRAMDMRRL